MFEKFEAPGGLVISLHSLPIILWIEPANENKEKEVISATTADLKLKMR